ncbi:uncharacterized protein LOC112567240 [Pomacea canaliculata]|uniref:uncharacterized protein LOC112567240 n=1 Tax=Pomacea canaliculata TaxID=400727 RepID=UPI000D7331FD|nr:uncharacterized protein LOC112567240 [Pomacea canaliculata]XP_025099648.1 uncharacterized protein LOC112567240 [Pomacea canaliculata]
MSEDSLMTQELQAVLGGMQIASGSASPEPDSYVVQWIAPRLSGSKKVSEYRITYKKILLKNKECDDPRLWRVHQSASPTPTKLSVSGEMSSCRLERLERDSFYEVTVEALVHNMAACSAKKLFKTDDKVPVPSLATPKKLVRSNSRSSYTASSPRTPNGHVK